MREIKFRAFHKDTKIMYPVISFCDDFIKILTIGSGVQKVTISEFESIQQFTGLKDKNGKEIYEGDWLIMGYVAVVRFLEGMFCTVYEHPEDGEVMPLSDTYKDCEIIEFIGNESV